jgi:hopene-associated glycosyltransferase HpnB
VFLISYFVASVPVLIWAYLWIARGRFWSVAGALAAKSPPAPPRKVVVLIPARNEATVIGAAVSSLARQIFAGSIHIIVIDDASSDGTAEVAAAAADASGASVCPTVLRGAPLPVGWTGKLWALSQGVAFATELSPDFLLLTDADIEHDTTSVASLVDHAEACELDLVSHMVQLSTASWSERLLIPAFVFFFFKLYPPRWVASTRSRTAAAAGGCILIRPSALARVGGLQAIRSQIIDDCGLARAVKGSGGRIWLGLTREAHSLRAYQSAGEIGAMISRTAFSQLHHSYAVLLVTLVGLFLTYLLPVLLLLAADPVSLLLGVAALILMSLCYLPMVRFYRLPGLWCICLPAISLFYIAAVLHSALQYARGRGGMWKGRVQDAQTGAGITPR